MLVTLALSILKAFIKNPAKAATMKRELLEIRDAIDTLFPNE